MVRIIPTPKQADFYTEKEVYRAAVRTDFRFAEAVEAFRGYALKKDVVFSGENLLDAPVRVEYCEKMAGEPEKYLLSAKDGRIVLKAGSNEGINRGLSAFLQVIEPAAEGCFATDIAYIKDFPDSSYRGFMIDLARNWHDFSYLLQYVDLCWIYRVRTLHVHFTDDQSYTLPSKLLPKVPTEGRSYTFGQMRTLCEYARARGIQIMPEIDIPGHCTSFQQAYPELFGTSGVLDQTADAVEMMKKLFRELCGMFPYSENIHIGGDEAAIDKWADIDCCLEYAKTLGITFDREKNDPGERRQFCEKLYLNFVLAMADAVKECGRRPIVWEGFPKESDDLVPRDILVMSWENFFQITPDLLDAGFDIINCSWNPLYIVAPEPAWPPREVYDWTVRKWKPVHPGSPILHTGYESEPNGRILGGQLLAWGDRIPTMYPSVEEGVADERRLVTERLPYVAQNTWNIGDSKPDFGELAAGIDAINRMIFEKIYC